MLYSVLKIRMNNISLGLKELSDYSWSHSVDSQIFPPHFGHLSFDGTDCSCGGHSSWRCSRVCSSNQSLLSPAVKGNRLSEVFMGFIQPFYFTDGK